MIPQSLKDELITAAVLHYLYENNGLDILSTHWSVALADEEIRRLSSDGLIEISSEDRYVLTSSGKKAYQKVLGAIDQLRKFEIFAKVYFVNLPQEMCAIDEETGDVLPYVLSQYHDPRFIAKEAMELDSRKKPQDLRLAMMSYVMSAIENSGTELEEYNSTRIVFLQKLIDSELNGDFWGSLFSGQWIVQCDEISQSQLRWEDLAIWDEGLFDDEDQMLDEAWERSKALYESGMIEMQKLNGSACGYCEAPLAVMEEEDEGGNPVCEGCGTSIYTPPPTEFSYSCPCCGAHFDSTVRKCSSCGISFDYRLKAGEESETVTKVTEVVYEEDNTDRYEFWEGDYYVGYPLYDPYDPLVDALAFALICNVMF